MLVGTGPRSNALSWTDLDIRFPIQEMTTPSPSASITLSIAAVERDSGLSKDTLRVWERRYGFPQPARDGIGERAYPLDQVERLRIVKRLLDAGHRPGRVVSLPLPALQQLAESTVDRPMRAPQVVLDASHLSHLVALIRSHAVPALRLELARLLARQGVRGFVVDVVAPLNQAVGDAWMRGQLQIFEEHLYSEVVQSALRQALATIPPPDDDDASTRVLLTTLPGRTARPGRADGRSHPGPGRLRLRVAGRADAGAGHRARRAGHAFGHRGHRLHRLPEPQADAGQPVRTAR